ncbi:5977_t:CDS:1, partial [Acaulospora colombiana]
WTFMGNQVLTSSKVGCSADSIDLASTITKPLCRTTNSWLRAKYEYRNVSSSTTERGVFDYGSGFEHPSLGVFGYEIYCNADPANPKQLQC